MSTRLAVIGGDGIGPEVVAVGLQVLDAVLPGVERTEYDLGARAYTRTGEALPDSVLDELRGHDAILLGAIGDPSVPPGVLERGLLLRAALRARPPRQPASGAAVPGGRRARWATGRSTWWSCARAPRARTSATAGGLRAGTPHEVATEVSLNTAYGVERVVRDAFARAQARERKHLTLVHKTNVLVHAGGLWKRVFDEVAAEFPDVATDYQHVDAASMFFVTQPERFDVVVTDNLFGDILTDIGAAIGGGIGLAASGNIDATRTNPSMFEPVHGSAPDIAGQGKADPTAAVLSVALLLEHLGHAEQAAARRAGGRRRPRRARAPRRAPRPRSARRCSRGWADALPRTTVLGYRRRTARRSAPDGPHAEEQHMTATGIAPSSRRCSAPHGAATPSARR